MVKVPDGEMSRAEIVRLIKKYNEKMGIDPKGKSRDQLIKEIEALKYKIDHVKKDLVLTVKQKTKKQPRNVKADPIKQKTALQKQKAAEKKEEKEMEKKKELRKVKKELADKIINREKDIKEKTRKNKKDMKPKQPKQTQKLKSQKEDEVRPKEKVGRPKVDPKKIKVIDPKKKEKTNEEKPTKKKPIKLSIITSQYIARIFATAMEDIMGEKEENKNIQLYRDIQSRVFDGDKLYKFLSSKSKTNEKKRNKIIQSLEYWAKEIVGSNFKPLVDFSSIADVDDTDNHPLGLPFNQYDMGAVSIKDLLKIGELVEAFTPYKLENDYYILGDKNIEDIKKQKYIKK